MHTPTHYHSLINTLSIFHIKYFNLQGSLRLKVVGVRSPTILHAPWGRCNKRRAVLMLQVYALEIQIYIIRIIRNTKSSRFGKNYIFIDELELLVNQLYYLLHLKHSRFPYSKYIVLKINIQSINRYTVPWEGCIRVCWGSRGVRCGTQR